MRYVWTILKRDLKGLLPGRNQNKVKGLVRFIAGLAFFAGFGAGLTYGAYRLFVFIDSLLGAVPSLSQGVSLNLLGGVSVFAVVVLIISGLQTAYRIMYESDDIGFLMAQPVPVWAVFVAKFLSAYVSVISVSAIVGLPAFLGFGLAKQAPPTFYLRTLVGFVFLVLMGHSLLSYLLLFAMKRLRGRKMKQMFVAFTAIFGILIVLGSQMLSSSLSRVQDPEEIFARISASGVGSAPYLPTTWMMRYILGPVVGVEGTLLYGGLLVGASSLLTYISIRVSGKWFSAGWAGKSEESPQEGAIRRLKRAKRTGRPSALKGAYRTILAKDLTLLWRDPIVWYSLVIGLIVLGFFIFNTKTQMRSGITGGPVESLLLMMGSLMGSVASAQTGGISLSREGSSFWMIRCNPVTETSLLEAKLTYAVLPSGVMMSVFLFAARLLGLPSLPLWRGLLVGMSMVGTIGVVQILLDVYFPDFTMKMELGSAKSGKGTGKLLTTMFLSMGLTFLYFFILISPAILHGRLLFPWMTVESLTTLSHSVIVGLALVVVSVGWYAAKNRLRRILRDM